MALIIDNLAPLPLLLAAPRAIVLVSVPWSPWPRKSRELLFELEATRHDWSPQAPVQFFDLWPERDDELNRWYEVLCVEVSSRFELHGSGSGPFWYLANATILGCIARPHDLSLELLQQRSLELLPIA